jgi:hypothetical protein
MYTAVSEPRNWIYYQVIEVWLQEKAYARLSWSWKEFKGWEEVRKGGKYILSHNLCFMHRKMALVFVRKTGDWFLCSFFFFCSTRVWTQGLHLEPLHQPYFCEGFIEIGSSELLARAGFEPQSSLISDSWVVKITRMSHQLAPGLSLLICWSNSIHAA